MEIFCQVTEVLRLYRLFLFRTHGEYFYKYLCRFFHCMHKTESQVKIFSGAEHTMMSPDSHIVFFHQFTCRHGNIPASRYHPSHDADAVRKYNRALCSLRSFLWNAGSSRQHIFFQIPLFRPKISCMQWVMKTAAFFTGNSEKNMEKARKNSA